MTFAAFVVISGLIGVDAGACNSKDQDYIKDHYRTGDTTFGAQNNDCEHANFNTLMIWRGLNRDGMVSCLEDKTGISNSCAECYGDHGQYGFDNCKVQCLFSWCTKGCLDCLAGHLKTLHECTGFNPGALDKCDGEVKLVELDSKLNSLTVAMIGFFVSCGSAY